MLCHAMDCIVWFQKITSDIEDSATPEHVVTEHRLPEEDLKNILSISLINEDIKNSQCSQTSVQAIHSTSESDTELSEHEKATEGSLRQWHLIMLLTNREERQKEKSVRTPPYVQYCEKVMRAKCANFVLCPCELSMKFRLKIRASFLA